MVTPNVVTTAGICAAAIGALNASSGSWFGMVMAAFWLHVSFILDSCDGELARISNRQTRFGKWYDVTSDVVKDFFLWIGLFVGATHQGAGGPPLVFALSAAGLGSSFNFALVLWERHCGCSFHPADLKESGRRKYAFFQILDSMSHNGISILLAWLAALWGNAFVFLAGAAIFLNILAAIRLITNFRQLASGFSLQRVVLAVGKLAALLAGVWIFWVSAKDLSWPHLKALFLNQGALLLVPALLVFPIACIFHTLGFLRLFSEPVRRAMPFSKLYTVYLAGDALNKITPFADVGGEPLKIWWTSRSRLASSEESLAVTYLSKLMFVLAEGFFILAGVAAMMLFRPSPLLVAVGAAGTAFTFVFFWLLAVFPRRALKWLRRPGGMDGEVAETLIRNVLRSRRNDLLVSFLWNFLGCAVLFFEIYLALKILGLSISAADSLLIQTLLRAIQAATFFIPAQIGSQESGLIYLLTHFHFPSVHGLAVSILRRVRQLGWAFAAGILFFILNRRQTTA